jgi:FAD/FMN-containing dehydrogenase
MIMEQGIKKLKSKISGTLVLPGDEAYDEARKIYNGMIDKYPAIILQCQNIRDVQLGVNYAREHNMDISIKSGGHSGAGLALVDEGLVIDLSPLKKIEIDNNSRTAKIQAGNTLKEIDKATHEYGLALPAGIIGTTGIGGLTLGGGMGYLSRKGGLTIDNLKEAEIVLANGEIVIANKNSHGDLFWAIRGGGGNFGVIVNFTFDLIPIKNVYGGPMFWPLSKAEEAMKFYDELTADASNDLYGFFAFLVVPPEAPFPEKLHNERVCGVLWCYTGPIEKAEEVFKPIRGFGPPILDFVGEIPMPALNSMFDDLYSPGMHWYWKAHFINEFKAGAIRESIKYGSKIPSIHSTTHFYPIDGKVHEVENHETAWANRDARWAQVIVGVDPNPATADISTQWCKDYFEAMKPYAMNGGAYVNFMMDEGQERVKAAYGKNYDRLVKVKTKYDPDNLFHINQNIKPEIATDTEPIAAE